MKDKCNFKFNKLSVAVICAMVFAVVTTVILIALLNERETASGPSPMGINELIQGQTTLKLMDESIDETTKDEILATDQVPLGRMVTQDIDEYSEEIQNVYSGVLVNDFENIKAKDKETVIRYFGDSQAFSPDVVADKVAATKISVLSEEIVDETTKKLVIHICTLDYYGMKESSSLLQEELASQGETDVEETVKKEIAKLVVTGNFALHYTIPVTIKDGTVMVTEELKQAITGGWYKGLNTELKQVDCPLEG